MRYVTVIAWTGHARDQPKDKRALCRAHDPIKIASPPPSGRGVVLAVTSRLMIKQSLRITLPAR